MIFNCHINTGKSLHDTHPAGFRQLELHHVSNRLFVVITFENVLAHQTDLRFYHPVHAI